MKRLNRDALIIIGTIFVLAFAVLQARSEPQTRFYDAKGNSIGTAAPQSGGSVRYYDSRGSSLGTSTTHGNTIHGVVRWRRLEPLPMRIALPPD